MVVEQGTQYTFNVFASQTSGAVPTNASIGTGGGSMSAWTYARTNKMHTLVQTSYSLGTSNHSLPTGATDTGHRQFDVRPIPTGEINPSSIPTGGQSGIGGNVMNAWYYNRADKIHILAVSDYSVGTSAHTIPSGVTDSYYRKFDVRPIPNGEETVNKTPGGAGAGTGGGDMPTWSETTNNQLRDLVTTDYSINTSSHSLPHGVVDAYHNNFDVGFPTQQSTSEPTSGVIVGYNFKGVQLNGKILLAKSGVKNPTNPVAITDGTVSAIGPLNSAVTHSYPTSPKTDSSFQVPASEYGEWKVKADRQYLDSTSKTVKVNKNTVNISASTQSVGTLYYRITPGSATTGYSYRNISIGLD